MKKTISAIFIVCLFLMMVSCKTKTVLVPVESVKTEYRDKLIRDSIFMKELVRIYQKGDTIFKDSIVYEYRNKLVKDTVNLNDTIRVPILVPSEPVYVDKPDTWLDKTQKYIARIGLALLALFLLIKYRSNILKFIRKWVFKF